LGQVKTLYFSLVINEIIKEEHEEENSWPSVHNESSSFFRESFASDLEEKHEENKEEADDASKDIC